MNLQLTRPRSNYSPKIEWHGRVLSYLDHIHPIHTQEIVAWKSKRSDTHRSTRLALQSLKLTVLSYGSVVTFIPYNLAVSSARK